MNRMVQPRAQCKSGYRWNQANALESLQQARMPRVEFDRVYMLQSFMGMVTSADALSFCWSWPTMTFVQGGLSNSDVMSQKEGLLRSMFTSSLRICVSYYQEEKVQSEIAEQG